MKRKGILDRKGTDKTVRKQERKKATFYCSFVSLNRRYLVEVSIDDLFLLCDYRGLQEVTGGYRGLRWVTGNYRGLQKGLQKLTTGYRGVTSD